MESGVSARAEGLSRNSEVADRLHSVAIRLLRRLRREDEAAGLTAPQLSALSVVVFSGPVSLGELAAAEQVRPPTMTRVVRQLEAQGLVAREVDAADRRVVRLHATASGERVLGEGRGRRVAALSRRLALLPPDQREALSEAVALVEQLLEDPW